MYVALLVHPFIDGLGISNITQGNNQKGNNENSLF